MEKTEAKRKNAPAAGARARRKRKGKRCSHYPDKIRMKAVRLHLEEGMDLDLVCQEFGINPCTFRNWIYRYRKYGESGVVGHGGKGKAKPKIPVQVKAKIVEMKKENGPFGIQKISDMLRKECIIEELQSSTKRDVLSELSGAILQGTLGTDREIVVDVLFDDDGNIYDPVRRLRPTREVIYLGYRLRHQSGF